MYDFAVEAGLVYLVVLPALLEAYFVFKPRTAGNSGWRQLTVRELAERPPPPDASELERRRDYEVLKEVKRARLEQEMSYSQAR